MKRLKSAAGDEAIGEAIKDRQAENRRCAGILYRSHMAARVTGNRLILEDDIPPSDASGHSLIV